MTEKALIEYHAMNALYDRLVEDHAKLREKAESVMKNPDISDTDRLIALVEFRQSARMLLTICGEIEMKLYEI